MRDSAFHNKITWYSFFFSLLVVWIHAYNAELFLGKGADATFPGLMETFLGERIGQIAVPGFFMISGYLFFVDFDWGKLRGKWTRRIYSVMVPYIVWNAIYYVGYVIGSRLPWMNRVVGKGVIPLSLPELTEALLYYKYNPVFWYMYQLIFLIVLAPVLYVVLKQAWSAVLWFGMLGLALAVKAELPVINVDALIYYSTAAEVAIVRKKILDRGESTFPPIRISQKTWQLAGACLIALAVWVYDAGLVLEFTALFVLGRLLAIGGLWLLVPAKLLPQAGDIISNHFFLYATHFAFVRMINKSAAMILPASPAIPLLLYLLMPGIVLAISTVGNRLLKRFLPGLGIILNGGRS